MSEKGTIVAERETLTSLSYVLKMGKRELGGGNTDTTHSFARLTRDVREESRWDGKPKKRSRASAVLSNEALEKENPTFV